MIYDAKLTTTLWSFTFIAENLVFQLTVDCMSSSLIVSVPQRLAFSSVKLEDFMDLGNKYMWHIFCASSSIAVVTCSKCNMHAVFMDRSCHPFHILKVYEKHSCLISSCSSFPFNAPHSVRHCANKPESDIRSENLSHMQERSAVTQCCQFELKKNICRKIKVSLTSHSDQWRYIFNTLYSRQEMYL